MSINNTLLVSIICPDRPGLIADIAGLLFDLGVNLADTSFAVLGKGSEFTAVCEVPPELTADDLRRQLQSQDEFRDAEIQVKPFQWAQQQGPGGHITHRIVLQGRDQPGLVARLTEVFGDYDANIVRMDTRTLPLESDREYLIELAVSIPAGRADACLATVNNTAASLDMHSTWVQAQT